MIADDRMEHDLAKAYGDYEYSRDADRNNEKRNQQFFGFDDPDRAKKVERAIELRWSFEDSKEWQKEKMMSGKMIRDLTIERQKKIVKSRSDLRNKGLGEEFGGGKLGGKFLV